MTLYSFSNVLTICSVEANGRLQVEGRCALPPPCCHQSPEAWREAYGGDVDGECVDDKEEWRLQRHGGVGGSGGGGDNDEEKREEDAA